MYIADRNVKCFKAIVETDLVTPQKVKHRFTIGQYNPTPKYVTVRFENRTQRNILHGFS